jgi:glycosyltransferase involved in cell wall biosynthesis
LALAFDKEERAIHSPSAHGPSGAARAPSPLVSYVVTLFNKAPFAPLLAASLLGQQAPGEAEYVFVDDGSTDGSAAAVRRSMAGVPGVVIIEQGNRGPSMATNAGVRAAHGDYIKLLDGDDILVPGITALMIAELERQRADLIVGGLGLYDPAAALPEEAPDLGRVTRLDDPLLTVIGRGLGNSSGTLFRRSAFLAAGGCDESVFIQDVALFPRMAVQGPMLTAEGIVARVPEAVPGRVSGMTGQALHDANRAIYNLIVARPDLGRRYKVLAMRRAAGRAWKWARRHRRASVLSPPSLANLLGHLPLPSLAPWVLRESCRPFREDSNLRFMDPPP